MTCQPCRGEVSSPKPAPACDVCKGPTYELHCKIICRNCGYTRDCSDL